MHAIKKCVQCIIQVHALTNQGTVLLAARTNREFTKYKVEICGFCPEQLVSCIDVRRGYGMCIVQVRAVFKCALCTIQKGEKCLCII